MGFVESVSSSFDGVPVAFEVSGSGSSTVVFVHGLVGDHTDFDLQAGFLASTRRVVAVDLPGAGESGHDRLSWTMEGFGEDVATVVNHLGLDRVVLVGHSLGGNVTVEAARRLGGRVAGLVWLSSFRSLDSFPSTSETAAWLAPFHADPLAAVEDLNRRNFGPDADPVLINSVVAKARARDPERTLGLVTAMFQHDRTVAEALTHLDAPVVAINPTFKPIDEESFRRHGVDLKLINGVGHFLMMEAPSALNNQLQQLLDGPLQTRT